MTPDLSAIAQDDSDEKNVPVIIVGAGPVGLLLALQLAQKQIRSVVLEQSSSLSQIPRGLGYFGHVHGVFQEAGLYETIVKEGLASAGYNWRKLPTDVVAENGLVTAKALGPIIATNHMSRPGPDGRYIPGHFSILLPQCRLAEIFLEEAAKTGLVEVLWNHRMVGLAQDEDEVSVTVEVMQQGHKTFKGQYLAACDGSKSTVRNLLGIRLSGHSWPERFLAADVLRTAPMVAQVPTHFVVDEKFWGVVTPLEKVEAGKRGLWRYSLAVPADPSDEAGCPGLTDEQILEPDCVDSLLLRQIDGPRPSDHVVVRKSLYRMHQLLASTMHRGRCFLAGDSAHLNNPIGGLGLCTGLLDADALSQTLDMAISAARQGVTSKVFDSRESTALDLESLFGRYSMERRRVFQNIVHPFSTANKLRLHGAGPDDAAREDWYFQVLARGDPRELEEIHRPLHESWRTDMKRFFSARGENGSGR